MSGVLLGRAGRDSAGLEVAAWVEGEFSDELAGVAVDDPDVEVVDQRVTRVPAWRRPRPMWCSRLSWRRVTVPVLSTRSCRTRQCGSM